MAKTKQVNKHNKTTIKKSLKFVNTKNLTILISFLMLLIIFSHFKGDKYESLTLQTLEAKNSILQAAQIKLQDAAQLDITHHIEDLAKELTSSQFHKNLYNMYLNDTINKLFEVKSTLMPLDQINKKINYYKSKENCWRNVEFILIILAIIVNSVSIFLIKYEKRE